MTKGWSIKVISKTDRGGHGKLLMFPIRNHIRETLGIQKRALPTCLGRPAQAPVLDGFQAFISAV
ncbi:hypothetical protein OA90_27920 [Labrenzia sp. OB1]|nr:hypothetical protein OA90_27920 [Labrenzia sp. OB1]